MKGHRTLGEFHGSMIFYEKSETENFLEHMEEWIGDEKKFLAYLEGFLDGLRGGRKARFRRTASNREVDALPPCLQNKQTRLT